MDDTNSAIMYAQDAGLTARSQIDPEQPIKAIQLLDEDGNPIRFPNGAAAASYTMPAASLTAIGGIKMANAIADPDTSTIGQLSAFSTGSAPTEDNLNQVVTQVNTIAMALNTVIETQKEILAKLRGNGVIEQS